MKKFGTSLILFTLCSILAAQNFGLEFDGDYESEVMISQTSDLTPTAAITVEAWVKLNALTNLPTIVSSEDWSSGETGFVLRIENYNLSNTPQFQIGTSSSWQTVSAASNAIPYDEWTHVAGTFDGSAVKIFINGVEAGSTDFTGAILPSPIGVKIGGHVDHTYNNRQWDGAIDEVRIWEVARNSAELTASMFSSLSGSEEGLIGYWMFNEGEGTSIGDATSNANDGTVFGATWVDGAPINMEAGTVEGVVNMIGGEAMPNDVLVSAGGVSTYPNVSGYFSMQVPPGEYELSCTMGYFYPYFEDIVVILDETINVTAEVHWLESPTNLAYDSETNMLIWEVPNTQLTVTGYVLYNNSEVVAEIEATELSYSPEVAGTYDLTAMYDEYESIPGNYVEVALYNPPQNLILTLEDDNDARLNWDVPEEGGATLTSFKVYRDSVAIVEVASDVFTYTDENLQIAEYEYYVTAFYYYEESGPSNIVELEVLVDIENEEVMPIVSLGNYPNPFNPITEIRFTAKSAEEAKVEIYNIKGQKIVTLSNPTPADRIEGRQGTTQCFNWNGKNDSGSTVSSGIYFYKLKSGKRTLVRKMVLMK